MGKKEERKKEKRQAAFLENPLFNEGGPPTEAEHVRQEEARLIEGRDGDGARERCRAFLSNPVFGGSGVFISEASVAEADATEPLSFDVEEGAFYRWVEA